jgi:hypothetical protein
MLDLGARALAQFREDLVIRLVLGGEQDTLAEDLGDGFSGTVALREKRPVFGHTSRRRGAYAVGARAQGEARPSGGLVATAVISRTRRPGG